MNEMSLHYITVRTLDN